MIPETLIKQWSTSGDRDVKEEMIDYIRDEFDDMHTVRIECWRGDTTASPVTSVELDDTFSYDTSSSWTDNRLEAEKFAAKAVETYGGEQIIYHFPGAEVIDISDDRFPFERREFLAYPGAIFLTTEVKRNTSGVWEVDVAEV